ncbi:MAG TPA: hypothetical protein VKV40_09200 [Ktedonobacteraceae bacterium]|nr:hypothetical protein [Ktedonobacteraceae bacterium]
MRGKLRDKRVDFKRDPFKREGAERRRPLSKRENRSLAWLNQQLEEEEDDYLAEDEVEEELMTPAQPVQPAQQAKAAQPVPPRKK